MKYLVVARGYNEPDNNTPSDVLWAKTIDIDPTEQYNYEKRFEEDMAEDYEHGVDIDFYPLVEFEDEWVKVGEIW